MMKWFSDLPRIYLHRDCVDFREAVNELCVVVQTAREIEIQMADSR